MPPRLFPPGTEIVPVALDDHSRLTWACREAQTVISTLSGLRETIDEGQRTLLDAAVEAGVSRFIPSDFSIGFDQVPPGSNRNVDLRREFGRILDSAPIHATSIFNGSFETLLLTSGPFVIYPARRVLYWSSPDHPLDFTHMDDVARFTAAAALDLSAPRYLHIASARLTARRIAETCFAVSGRAFKLIRGGDIRRMARLGAIFRKFLPQKNNPFSLWQGMQYLKNMHDPAQTLPPLDNDRYSGTVRRGAQDIIAEHYAAG